MLSVMKVKLKTGEKQEIEFADKKYLFEKVNPFFLRVTTEDLDKLVSIEKSIEIRIDKIFHDRPYFFRWKTPIQASPKTTLKFLLRLPLQKKLVVEAGKKDIEIDKYFESTKLAWHGQVYEGELCDFIEPEVYFEPRTGDFANLPIRIVNPGNETRLIKKFVLNTERMMLFKAENGLFTNKVYVNILGEDKFSISYGKVTTKAAEKPKKIIAEKTKSARKILTSFSPLNLAREFGL